MACNICYQFFNPTKVGKYNSSFDFEKISKNCASHIPHIFNHEAFDWKSCKTIKLIPFCQECTTFLKSLSDSHEQLQKHESTKNEELISGVSFSIAILKKRRNRNNPIVNSWISNPEVPVFKLSSLKVAKAKECQGKNIALEKHGVFNITRGIYNPPSLAKIMDSSKADIFPSLPNVNVEPCSAFASRNIAGIRRNNVNEETKIDKNKTYSNYILDENNKDEFGKIWEKRANISNLRAENLKPNVAFAIKQVMSNNSNYSSNISDGEKGAEPPAPVITPTAVCEEKGNAEERERNNGPSGDTPPIDVPEIAEEILSSLSPSGLLPTSPASKPQSIAENHWRCFTCSQVFATRKTLRKHCQENHIHKKLYRCNKCRQWFQRRNHLKNHMKRHSNVDNIIKVKDNQSVEPRSQFQNGKGGVGLKNRTDNDYKLRLEMAMHRVFETGCSQASASEHFKVNRSTLSVKILKRLRNIEQKKPIETQTEIGAENEEMEINGPGPDSYTDYLERDDPPDIKIAPLGLYGCKDCLVNYSNARQLKCHLCVSKNKANNLPEEMELFHCTHCRKAFLTKPGLSYHRRRLHTMKSFPVKIGSRIKKPVSQIPDRIKSALALVISGKANISTATARFDLDKGALYPYMNVKKRYVLKNSVLTTPDLPEPSA